MATKTWFGGTGNFNNPNYWTPTGVPQAGDLAVLTTGTVEIHGPRSDGVDFSLQGTSQDTKPVIALRNIKLNAGVNVSGSFSSIGRPVTGLWRNYGRRQCRERRNHQLGGAQAVFGAGSGLNRGPRAQEHVRQQQQHQSEYFFRPLHECGGRLR